MKNCGFIFSLALALLSMFVALKFFLMGWILLCLISVVPAIVFYHEFVHKPSNSRTIFAIFFQLVIMFLTFTALILSNPIFSDHSMSGSPVLTRPVTHDRYVQVRKIGKDRGEYEVNSEEKKDGKWHASKEQISHESRALLLERVFGKLPRINHPELAYRSAAEVRHRYKGIFHDLPEEGFHSSFKNPCWYKNEAASSFVCLPYAYLLGMPKCGTSDLWEHVSKHPDVRNDERRKEVRWFTRGEFVSSPVVMNPEELKIWGASYTNLQDFRGLNPLPETHNRRLTSASLDPDKEWLGNEIQQLKRKHLKGKLPPGKEGERLSPRARAREEHENEGNPTRSEGYRFGAELSDNVFMDEKSDLRSFTRALEVFTSEIRPRAYGEVVSAVADRLVTLDGGPHTLWWPIQMPDGSYVSFNQDISIPQLMREMQPDAKFFITLTDPADRMYSDYNFLGDDLKPVRGDPKIVQLTKTAEDFHLRALWQVEEMKNCIEYYAYQPVTAITSDNYERMMSDVIRSHGYPKRKDTQSKPLWNNTLPKDSLLWHEDGTVGWFRASQICAHDRVTFGRGGWGRLAIGMYVVFIEKWLEHFDLSQFLIMNLNDFNNDARGYLKKLFRFLGLRDPSDKSFASAFERQKQQLTDMDPADIDENAEDLIWDVVLSKRVSKDGSERNADKKYANQHKFERTEMMRETRVLLNEFYAPYNELLASLVNNTSFLYRGGAAMQFSVYDYLNDKINKFKASSAGKSLSGYLQPDVSAGVDKKSGSVSMSKISDSLSSSSKLRGFVDQMAKLGGMESENIIDENLEAEGAVTLSTAQSLCQAALLMDLDKLKVFNKLDTSSIEVVDVEDSDRNPLHCLAFTYLMVDASAKSLLFNALKGKDIWQSKYFSHHVNKSAENSVAAQNYLISMEDHIVKVGELLLDIIGSSYLNVQDKNGYTPLHVAATNGLPKLVNLYLDNGADVNVVNHVGRTALHYAAAHGHAEACRLLIDRGAAMNIKDIYKVTAVDIFASPGGPIIARDFDIHFKGLKIERKERKSIPYDNSNEGIPAAVEGAIHPNSDNGGWSTERIKGFERETDRCDLDMYYANEITADELLEKYINTLTPVLIKGLINDWPGNDHYRKSSLVQRRGSMQVIASSIPYANKFGGLKEIKTNLSSYIESMDTDHSISSDGYPFC